MNRTNKLFILTILINLKNIKSLEYFWCLLISLINLFYFLFIRWTKFVKLDSLARIRIAEAYFWPECTKNMVLNPITSLKVLLLIIFLKGNFVRWSPNFQCNNSQTGKYQFRIMNFHFYVTLTRINIQSHLLLCF